MKQMVSRAHVAQAGAVPGKGTALGVRQAWAESWLHATGWMTLERPHHLFEPHSLICKKGTKKVWWRRGGERVPRLLALHLRS